MEDNRSRENGNERMMVAFNRDEVRTLRECNSESFYYRCLPFSLLIGGTSFIMMRNGFLTKSVKYGYLPKVIAGGALGYFVGKLSYRSQCEKKILRLPNSPLADAIRKRRAWSGKEDNLPKDYGYSSFPSQDTDQPPIFDDHRPDIRDHNEGLDAYNKVTDSLTPYSGDDEEPSFTSYEELRLDNRTEHANKLKERNRRPNFASPDSYSSGDRTTAFREAPTQRQSNRNEKKNIYGDSWEE